MAWTNVPLSRITFGLFAGSTAGATVSVAAADLLNDSTHKIILLVRNVPGDNINSVDVVGAFGQITFEVTRRKRLPLTRGKAGRAVTRL